MENAGKFEINIEKLEKYKYSFVRFMVFNSAKNLEMSHKFKKEWLNMFLKFYSDLDTLKNRVFLCLREKNAN